jgi:hydrogenase maturation protein HypF
MDGPGIKLPFYIRNGVLAFGSQNKNTVCFLKGSAAHISPVYSGLSNPDEFRRFENSVKQILRHGPKVIASDLHPEYLSAKSAQAISKQKGLKLLRIQHHHAHIASCMAENGLSDRKVIGVAFDGTGMGDDGTLWGAEFLVCDYKDFIRAGHLKEVMLIGGEMAILEPWRLLAAWGLDRPGKIGFRQWRSIKKIRASGFNSPSASSMGRLFDAAAALVLEKYRVDFEGQLPIMLERLAFTFKPKTTGYKFKTINTKNGLILDPAPILKGIVRDILRRQSKCEIAYRIHLTIAQMIVKTCASLRKKYGIREVVLSGGVFQNNLLLRLSLDLLHKQGFSIFFHKKISCNDAGISLGQAVITGFRS